jgi:hypothetical protein
MGKLVPKSFPKKIDAKKVRCEENLSCEAKPDLLRRERSVKKHRT